MYINCIINVILSYGIATKCIDIYTEDYCSDRNTEEQALSSVTYEYVT